MAGLFDDIAGHSFGDGGPAEGPVLGVAQRAAVRASSAAAAASAGGGGTVVVAATAEDAGGLAVEAAEDYALVPDDPADALSRTGSSSSSSSGTPPAAARKDDDGAAAQAKRSQLQFGDNRFQQVRDVPVALTDRLRDLARRNAEKPVDRVWIDKVSVSKLVTAYMAVKLGIRPKDVAPDEATRALMRVFAGLDPESEELNRRVEAVAASLRQQHRDESEDRRRWRAVERGVALLVAERLEPSRELLDLSVGTVNRDSYVRAERLLREAAVPLADADRRAEGVRS